jgi:Domain of unknown function (DUF4189)
MSSHRWGRRVSRFAVLVALLVVAVACQRPAGADGAMAVGVARGGVAKGYATGFAANQASEKAARTSAVEGCRKDKNSNADARSNCEAVVSFKNKCVASAVDPKSGTPGAGWGTGTTQKAADSQALARCRKTAGSDRADSCQIADRYCDGTAR